MGQSAPGRYPERMNGSKFVLAVGCLAAGLSACNRQSAVLPSEFRLSGTLYSPDSAASQAEKYGSWTDGAGTLSAAGATDGVALGSGSVAGSVAGSGAFSLALSGTVSGEHLRRFNAASQNPGDNCSGDLNISNPAALGTEVEFTFSGSDQFGVYVMPHDFQVTGMDGGETRYTYLEGVVVFVSAASEISGTLRCTVAGVAGQATTRYALKFRPGYNTVTLSSAITVDRTESITSSSMTVATGDLPAYWLTTPAQAALPLKLGRLSGRRDLFR